MRMLMTVSMPVEPANKAFNDGSLPKIMMGFIERYKPEAAYFTALDGKRTALFVFNLSDSSELPSIAEPFFNNLNAALTYSPVMNVEEMRTGVEKARAKK